MIVDDGGSEVVGVKPTVIDTFDLPAILSEEPIENDGEVIKKELEPKINPESTGFDGRTSCDVCTVQKDPAVTLPILKPVIVTMNIAAGIWAPLVVMIINGSLVFVHVPVKPCTLLLPAST